MRKLARQTTALIAVLAMLSSLSCLRAHRKGDLRIIAEPGLQVYLDKEENFVGETTEEDDGLYLKGIPTGRHAVTIKKSDSLLWQYRVRIRARKATELKVAGPLPEVHAELPEKDKPAELVPMTGSLKIRSVPPDCKVRFLAKTTSKNKDELIIEGIPAGTYGIEFRREGDTLTHQIVIKGARQLELLAHFEEGRVIDLTAGSPETEGEPTAEGTHPQSGQSTHAMAQLNTQEPELGPSFSNSIGMDMVWIRPGTFQMGSLEGEMFRRYDEGPVHNVSITRGFYISKYQVTQEEYEKVMNENPSYSKGKRNPVEDVSWHDAVKFCKKLTKIERRAQKTPKGYCYRLPTEAEWEYACRAGTSSPFCFGETITTDQANYNGNYAYGGAPEGNYRRKTVPVGSFPPNSFGLYDMHGNVWEWCSDWYDDAYYSMGQDTNPGGPKRGSSRVFRGGSWLSSPNFLRSASRSWDNPKRCRIDIGFRCVLGF